MFKSILCSINSINIYLFLQFNKRVEQNIKKNIDYKLHYFGLFSIFAIHGKYLV